MAPEYITTRFNNFWVSVDSKFQFDIVKSVLEKIYPEADYSAWEFSYINDYVIGFWDKPTYDLKISQRGKEIMTFREFIDTLKDKTEYLN